MAANKRDFANFDTFPGSINEGTGNYEFPLLYSRDTSDRLRLWQLFVRLVKSAKKIRGIDWDLLEEKQIPIKDDYFHDAELPAKTLAEAWVETGIEGGKSTRSAPTYFSEVAFEGQSNQRNPFQQALIYGRSLYLKRTDKGCTTNTSGTQKNKKTLNVMYFPMLAKSYKDGAKHLEYPLYIQPKLDGVRCLIFLKKKDGGIKNVVAYSRRKKEFLTLDHLKEALYEYLNDLYYEDKNQSIYLDGELYRHGKKLQDISGESRNEKKAVVATTQNEYHIYDCFYPTELDNIFETRLEQIDALFAAIKENGSSSTMSMIKQVPTYKMKDAIAVSEQYDKFVQSGYEGAILRNISSVYNAKATSASTRSDDLVKMKQKFTDEYEVVGFTEGTRGKDKGAIIWIAQTAGIQGNKVKFNVTPKDMTYAVRYKLFAECKKDFDTKYRGRMITVEYQDLSEAGVPLRAKALVFRDYE